MARRLGLVVACVLACPSGCGDNQRPPTLDLIATLSVERVSTLSADDVLATAIASLGDGAFVIARADSRGGEFCQTCPPSGCPATCRRAVIGVSVHGSSGAPEPVRPVTTVRPATPEHAIDAVDVVVLDRTHVGIAWLDCDGASCAPGLAKQRCTAQYTTFDLVNGHVTPVQTLFEDRFGELSLTYDPRARRLLAVTGTRRPSGAGVRAAIYDETAAMQLAPWQPFGGASARAPAAVTTAGGFLVVAEDPAPGRAPAQDPCTEACECMAAAPPELAAGGLFAFRPGLDLPAVRIAPGRGLDGLYTPREANATIDVGGQPAVASTQASERSAELFEPAVGGWLRRQSTRAPAAAWVGVLGDGDHLAWLGFEPTDAAAADRLVAGVVVEDDEQRGTVGEIAHGAVLDAAPIVAEDEVTRTFVLRGLLAPGADPPAWTGFEVLQVRADW